MRAESWVAVHLVLTSSSSHRSPRRVPPCNPPIRLPSPPISQRVWPSNRLNSSSSNRRRRHPRPRRHPPLLLLSSSSSSCRHPMASRLTGWACKPTFLPRQPVPGTVSTGLQGAALQAGTVTDRQRANSRATRRASPRDHAERRRWAGTNPTWLATWIHRSTLAHTEWTTGLASTLGSTRAPSWGRRQARAPTPRPGQGVPSTRRVGTPGTVRPGGLTSTNPRNSTTSSNRHMQRLGLLQPPSSSSRTLVRTRPRRSNSTAQHGAKAWAATGQMAPTPLRRLIP
mmetsp:Transcript_26271/g.76605  ORF Transcript_26271/g.76605 Transcript_26271/m.76605 type:complete len:284 (+) Transcript_26271:237-1088(+)